MQGRRYLASIMGCKLPFQTTHNTAAIGFEQQTTFAVHIIQPTNFLNQTFDDSNHIQLYSRTEKPLDLLIKSPFDETPCTFCFRGRKLPLLVPAPDLCYVSHHYEN